MLNKHNLFFFISLMLLITTFLPIFAENLPMGLGSFRYLWAPLWLISLVLFESKVFIQKNVALFVLYGLAILVLTPTLWYNMDEWFLPGITEEFYCIISSVSVLYYYVNKEDYRSLALLSKWVILFMGITAIMSIFASFINPRYARLYIQSSRTGYAHSSEGNLIRMLGAGLYSFGQSLVCVFPVLIHYLKKTGKLFFPKWVIIALIILFYVTLVRMQFFANILLGSLVIAISFIGSKQIKVSAVLIVIMLIFSFIIPKRVYVDILISTSEQFEAGSENQKKITDMASYLSVGSNETTGTARRLARYPLLYDAFIKKPFFGNAASNSPDDIHLGYHLQWMGKLGATGILGILLFFCPLIYFIKYWFEKYNIEYSFFAGISIAAFLFLGLMKVVTGRDVWFTFLFLIPSMYYLPILIENDDTFK